MDKQQIYEYLNRNAIWHEVTEHKAVFTMAEASSLELPYPEYNAKNLFVCEDKNRSYYLITVKSDHRIDLKKFRRENGIRKLSFASAAELTDLLGVIPGAVTPLGLLNDAECRVTLYLDSRFLDGPGIIGIHPNDNTATVWLKAADLIRMLQQHGNAVKVVPL